MIWQKDNVKHNKRSDLGVEALVSLGLLIVFLIISYYTKYNLLNKSLLLSIHYFWKMYIFKKNINPKLN